jgi:hypothetical protein
MRSSWEQEVRKDVTQKEGRKWEETEELLEDRQMERHGSRRPTSSGTVLGRRRRKMKID